MPVGVAACLFFTSPIWTAIFGYFWINESITKLEIFSVFMAFFGVILINKPWEKSSESEEKHSDKDMLIGSIFALTGAMSGAFSILCMRIMREGIHYSLAPFWFASGCCFCSPIIHCI